MTHKDPDRCQRCGRPQTYPDHPGGCECAECLAVCRGGAECVPAAVAVLPPPVHGPESRPRPAPAHYESGVEPLAAIEAWAETWPPAVAFHLGCAVKYLARCGRKGDMGGDLRKATDYLLRALAVIDGPALDARRAAAGEDGRG